MKIIHCPKGGRIPEGYCLNSCLNYPGKHKEEKAIPLRKSRNLFLRERKSWLQTYQEDILPLLKKAS